MKDLDSPEERAREREMLRTAKERKERGAGDYTHIALSVLLFIIAIVLYAVGYTWVAALVAVGFLFEMAAWITLFERNHPMPKAEVPAVSAGLERRGKGKDDAV